jgi:hypothetical protein
MDTPGDPAEHIDERVIGEMLDEMLESGVADRALGRLAPGALLWHNGDKVEVPAAEALRGVTGLHRLVEDITIDVVQHTAIPGGFLHRFALRGTVKASGTPLVAHNCIVVTLDGPMIARIDEYIDPTFRAQLGV